jgi:predicted RNase H-related nuclease YkuK (DUF458 family)
MISSETATEPNSEEADLLARSNKKIKVDMGKATNGRNVKQIKELMGRSRRSGLSYKLRLSNGVILIIWII